MYSIYYKIHDDTSSLWWNNTNFTKAIKIRVYICMLGGVEWGGVRAIGFQMRPWARKFDMTIAGHLISSKNHEQPRT